MHMRAVYSREALRPAFIVMDNALQFNGPVPSVVDGRFVAL